MRDPAAMRALRRKAAAITRERERERLQRDRQRTHLRQLAAAIATWSSPDAPDSGRLSPLATLAGEIERLHQELERQRRRTIEASVASERDGFRRGFVAGRGSSGPI